MSIAVNFCDIIDMAAKVVEVDQRGVVQMGGQS